jgi:hypothetical protein
VHLEVIADHLPGRGLVIDDHDVLALGHGLEITGFLSRGG